jgi:hypothetical protein
MMLQIEFWQLVSMCAAGLCAFAGVLWAVVRMGLSQAQLTQQEAQKQVLQRLDAIDVANKDAAHKSNKLERELLQLQVDLAKEYVRREDYILGQAVLEAKLDKVYEKLEVVQLKGERNVG